MTQRMGDDEPGIPMSIHKNRAQEYVQEMARLEGIENRTPVFETMRAYDGRIFMLDAHIERLFESAKGAGMIIRYTLYAIRSQLMQRLRKMRLKDAYLRVSIDNAGRLDIIAKPLTPYPKECYERGVAIQTVPIRHTSNFQVKSGDFLWGVLARREGAGRFEALLLNQAGHITEGTVSNIFIVKRRILFTPPPYSGILNGITRQVVIHLASDLGISTKEIPLTRFDLYTAEEVFLTNTLMEVVPVVSVDARKILEGLPGDFTKHLMEAYHERACNSGVK